MAASPCRAAAMPRPASALVPLRSWLDRAENLTSACASWPELNLASRNFDKAAENLGRAAQVHLSGIPAKSSSGKAGPSRPPPRPVPLDWSASDCPALDKEDSDKASRYLGSHGVMVPHITDAEKRTRRERIKAKRRHCGRKRRPLPKAPSGPTGRPRTRSSRSMTTTGHRLVSATRGHARRRGGDASGRGPHPLDQADDKVGVVDGSDWIKNQIQRQSLPLDDLGLDFYHLSENLHKARCAVYGEEDPKDEQAPGNVWVGRLLHTAKHEGYEALREQLQEWKGGLRGTSYRQAAEQVLNYVTDRREMIQYPKFLERAGRLGAGRRSPWQGQTQLIKGQGMRRDGTSRHNGAGSTGAKRRLAGLLGNASASPPDSRMICHTRRKASSTTPTKRECLERH